MGSRYHQRFKSTQQRFEEKVKKMDSGCHEWQSVLHRDGYGKFYYNGNQIPAHRAAYQIYKGEIGGFMVLHTCDNRLCVNPEHLYLGNAKQNTADMHERGRNVGNTKYSLDLVNEAKEMYASGMTQQQIANKLGIDQTTISKYVRGVQARQRKFQ